MQTPTQTPTGTTTEERSTTFRPVEGGNQMQSGERLLVEAYAAFWLVLFGLIALWWLRQRKIEDRMASLEGALARARHENEKKQGGG